MPEELRPVSLGVRGLDAELGTPRCPGSSRVAPGCRARKLEAVTGRAAAAADLRLLCASGVTGGDHRLAGKQTAPLSLFSSPNPKP